MPKAKTVPVVIRLRVDQLPISSKKVRALIDEYQANKLAADHAAFDTDDTMIQGGEFGRG